MRVVLTLSSRQDPSPSLPDARPHIGRYSAITTSGPAAANSLTISGFAAASVITKSTSLMAAKEQKEFRPILPEITGTIRRLAASSMARLVAASSGFVVVKPCVGVMPLTPMIARSTVKVLSRRLVQASTAAEVKPLIVPAV